MGDEATAEKFHSIEPRVLLQNPYLIEKRQDEPRSPSMPSSIKPKIQAESKNTATQNAASSNTANYDGTNVSALVISAAHKAGMDGIDRARIDAIILKESGNSKFMQQQRKRDEKVNERISKIREKLRNSPGGWRAKLERQIDSQIPQWIANRSARAVKVVVDMDMFFMACELLAKPHLRNVPAVVGGPSMIATSNYAARRFGVRSAMPGYIGEALVQQLSGGTEKLVYCSHNFDLYKAKASIVRETLSEYDPNLSAYSLDEAYLDISHYLLVSLLRPGSPHDDLAKDVQKMKDRPTEESVAELLAFSPQDCRATAESIVQIMRRRVQVATGGLTCSAGLAPNFLLAKIASDRKKPDGQMTVDPSKVEEFLRPLPVRKISGIGRVTEKILNAFGVETVEHLYRERALVAQIFETTSSSAAFLLRASVGCASSDGHVDESEPYQQKGISRERTFTAEQSWNFINEKLESIATMLSNDMAEKDFVAGSMSVKVKLHTFDCFSRSRTLPSGNYIYSSKDLASLAAILLQEIKAKYEKSQEHSSNKSFAVRLLGVRCSNLSIRQEVRRNMQTKLDEFVVPEAEASGVNCNPYLSPPRSRSPQRATTSRIPCPICSRRFKDEVAVSQHIDVCLNDQEIQSIQGGKDTKKRKRLLTDFFSVKRARPQSK